MEQVTQARDKVLDAIVDATEVPLPESVVSAEVESTIHDAVHAFDHDDAKFAEFLETQEKTREEFDAEARTEAEKSVKVRLILDALADAEQVTVSDQELTERIVYQAQQYGMSPDEFVQRIQQSGQLGAIYSDVRRSKALIVAVRAATVTDEAGAAVDLSDLLGPADDEAPEVVEGDVVDAAVTDEAADASDEAGDTPDSDDADAAKGASTSA